MVLTRIGVLMVFICALSGCETLVMPGSPGVVPVSSKQTVPVSSKQTGPVSSTQTAPESSRQSTIFEPRQAIPEYPTTQESPSSDVTYERRPASSPQPSADDHSAARLPVVSKLLGQSQTLMEQNNWPQAQQRLEQALRLSPQDPEIFLLYGDWYVRQDDNDGAREMYQRARALAGKGTREAQSASEKLEQLTWR